MSNGDSTSVPMTSRRVPRRTTLAPVEPLHPVPAVEAAPRNYGKQFVKWFRGTAAAGYGISIAFHAILLMVMSLVVFHELSDRDTFLETSISEPQDIETLQDIADVRIDMPAGDIVAKSESLESVMNLETSPLANTSITTGVENSLESLFEKEGAGGAGGSGFIAPKDAKVFTKGSFMAWTEPNDPKPGQDYKIMIVVKLPDRIQRYRATDLSGIVIGTDGYRQGVPGPEYSRGRVYLPIKDQTAQLVVTVPGAAARVRDTIEIRSTILNEKQRLEIEFQ